MNKILLKERKKNCLSKLLTTVILLLTACFFTYSYGQKVNAKKAPGFLFAKKINEKKSTHLSTENELEDEARSVEEREKLDAGYKLCNEKRSCYG